MKKKILLIGYNFHPEPTGIGKYSGEMIYWLAKKGYDCTVVTAYPYYPYWKIQEPYVKKKMYYTSKLELFDSGGQLRIYRCPMYVPAVPSGMKRILLDFSFLISAAIKIFQLLPSNRFDFVFVVVPSFQFGILGVLYKYVRKSKLLYHIQDMQIEAARDLQMIKSKSIINLLFKIEKFILRRADVVSSVSEGMVQRIQDKGDRKVVLFPNWTDINLFHPINNKGILKEEFGFRADDKIILYSGAIGEKQGLEAIMHAATEYRENDKIKFVICGSGPYKEKLYSIKEDLKLKNVIFFPLQPFEKFNRFLNSADVHLVIQKANASDLVMPSKLTTILAVGGLAVITADENSGLHSLVNHHHMGLLVAAENQQALNDGIRQAISEGNELLTRNARSYAENFLSIEEIMTSFEKTMMMLVEGQ